jgi:hypothetical protein
MRRAISATCRRKAEQELVEESHTHRLARILGTAPGLGPIRVARFLPIVVRRPGR